MPYTHNPPSIRALVVLSHHYALMQGRANTLSLHRKQACVEVRLLALLSLTLYTYIFVKSNLMISLKRGYSF